MNNRKLSEETKEKIHSKRKFERVIFLTLEYNINE